MGKHFDNKVMMVKIALASLLAVFSLTSCTRAVSSKASIRLSLPSNAQSKAGTAGTLNTSTSVLSHVIINVTASDIAPIFHAWEKPDPAVTSFSIDVPSGAGRLVQVLAVYKDTTTSDEQIFYGDKPGVDTTKDTPVEITILPISTATNLGEGRIAGRYVDSINSGVLSGPTGDLTMRFKPPGDRPAMVIETAEMIGGYFNTFATKNVPFEYVINKVSIFGGPVTADSGFSKAPASGEGNLNNGKAAQIYMPYYYERRDNGTYELRPESFLVFGHFELPGSNLLATNNKTCFSTIPGTVPYAYTDNTGSTEVDWATGSGARQFYGGFGTATLDSEQLCQSSGTRFTDYLSVDDKALKDNDRALAFQGPYRLKYNSTSTQRDALLVNLASGVLTIKFEYIPGAVTTAIRGAVDGTDLFWRARATNAYDENYRVDDGIACAKLTSSEFNFAPLGASISASPSTLSNNISMSTLPALFAPAFSEGRIDIVACPYRTVSGVKTYFKSAVSFHSYQGNTPATQISLSKIIGAPASGLRAANGVCTPFKIKGANGWLASVPLDFNSSNASVGVYSYQDCTTPASTNVTLTWINDGFVVYLKSTGTGTNSTVITISDSTSAIAPLVETVSFADLPSTPTQQAFVLAPAAIKSYSCYPISVIVRDGSTAADPFIMNLGTPYSYANFTWPGATNLAYYYNGDCTGTSSATANTAISAGTAMPISPAYFRYTGTAASLTLTPSDGGTPALPAAPASIAVTQPGPPKRLQFVAPNLTPVSTCTSLNVALQDANGYPTPTSAALTVTLNSTSSTSHIYTGSGGYCSCSSNEITVTPRTFTIATGTTTAQLCYSNTATETDVLTLSGTLSTSIPVTGGMTMTTY